MTNQNERTKEGALADARGFVTLLVDGRFREAAAHFDDKMKEALPEAMLQSTWSGLVQQFGGFERIEGARQERIGKHDIAFVTCKFARKRLDAKVVYDDAGKVTGLFFAPVVEPYSDPPYVDRTTFDEHDVSIGSDEWILPGTLSLPRGSARVPAVVLVHGSGPNDRDESIGANRPFKDIAGGIASRGMAVLRYDKRSKVHGAKLAAMSDATIDHEVVLDAVAAVALLRAHDRIDPKRIVVAGHSLGGYAAPRIGKHSKDVAGIAILAGSTREVPAMMLEQLEYIATVDEQQAPAIPAMLEQVKAAAARIRELQAGAHPKQGELVLGAGAAYWIDLARYDALATARSFARPVFVAQGGRDYQVTRVDFAAWQKALGSRKNVTFKLYDDLNHIFAAGTGKSTPREYEQRTPVDVRLIDDLATWIRTL